MNEGEWGPQDVHAALEWLAARPPEHREAGESEPDWEEAELAVILDALASQDAIDRLRAIDALGDWGDPRAIPALTPLEQDTDEAVRTAATDALGRIRARQDLPR
jgi:HEAT repeat protein